MTSDFVISFGEESGNRWKFSQGREDRIEYFLVTFSPSHSVCPGRFTNARPTPSPTGFPISLAWARRGCQAAWACVPTSTAPLLRQPVPPRLSSPFLSASPSFSTPWLDPIAPTKSSFTISDGCEILPPAKFQSWGSWVGASPDGSQWSQAALWKHGLLVFPAESLIRKT